MNTPWAAKLVACSANCSREKVTRGFGQCLPLVYRLKLEFVLHPGRALKPNQSALAIRFRLQTAAAYLPQQQEQNQPVHHGRDQRPYGILSRNAHDYCRLNRVVYIPPHPEEQEARQGKPIPTVQDPGIEEDDRQPGHEEYRHRHFG